jgi:hypothetical protein
MRLASAILTIFLLVTVVAPVRAQTDKDTTIRTTIIMRSKASDCPPGFTIFEASSGKKMPLASKICFVRTSKPAKH